MSGCGEGQGRLPEGGNPVLNDERWDWSGEEEGGRNRFSLEATARCTKT